MLEELRTAMAKRPWIGWAVALVLLGVAIGVYFLRGQSDSPYTPERMTEMLTIRYTDTNETERIPRGRLDKMLRGRKTFDPAEGITNPKTGKPTGFLVDDEEWNTMLQRIKSERDSFKNSGSSLDPSPAGGKK